MGISKFEDVFFQASLFVTSTSAILQLKETDNQGGGRANEFAFCNIDIETRPNVKRAGIVMLLAWLGSEASGLA